MFSKKTKKNKKQNKGWGEAYVVRVCETGHGGARLSSQHLGSEGRSIISSKLSLFSSELHGESGASLGISETISQIKQKQKISDSFP